MKKMMIMAFLAVPTLLFASCKTAKPTGTSTTVRSTIHVQYVPQDVLTDKFEDGMIEFGYAKSGDKGKAYRDALRSAQYNAATRLYNAITAVNTKFAQDIQMGKKSQFMSKSSERVVNIVNNKVIAIRNTKKPEFTRDEDGYWDCEVEIRIDYAFAKKIAQEVYKAIPNDDVLKVKHDEKEFVEEYEKQLRGFNDLDASDEEAEDETGEN
jgi:lipoprotein